MFKIEFEEVIIINVVFAASSIVIPVFTPYLKYNLILNLIKSGMNNILPNSLVIAVLSLILAYLDVAPIIKNKYDSKISTLQNIEILKEPVLNWMEEQVSIRYKKNILAGYILEQINSGLKIGLKFLLIFLIIDLLVTLILSTLSLQMLSPQGISLAIKVYLIITSNFFEKVLINLSHGNIF